VHLPHFVPEPPAARPAAPDAAGRPYVLSVGRLGKLKGLQDAIPLFTGPDPGCDLVIVGEGDYRASLERLAGDSPYVRFLGHRPYDEVGALYRGALAVLAPSLCYETFGLTVLEAFSMRTPVIARDHGALREIVEASGGGLLFRNVGELGQRIARLLEDRGLRDSLAARARAHYEAEGTPSRHVERYLDIVDSLRDRRPAAPPPVEA
jgi:glycosyltransferase involved in cell wall biosynthesis